MWLRITWQKAYTNAMSGQDGILPKNVSDGSCLRRFLEDTLELEVGG